MFKTQLKYQLNVGSSFFYYGQIWLSLKGCNIVVNETKTDRNSMVEI